MVGQLRVPKQMLCGGCGGNAVKRSVSSQQHFHSTCTNLAGIFKIIFISGSGNSMDLFLIKGGKQQSRKQSHFLQIILNCLFQPFQVG